jgi:hypothetical protein
LPIVYIGFAADIGGHRNSILKQGHSRMTYLEVVFRYGDAPGERELQAIDSVREVYGVQRVKFNVKDRTVRITYDASRLKQDAVAKMLRQAGVDIGDALARA